MCYLSPSFAGRALPNGSAAGFSRHEPSNGLPNDLQQYQLEEHREGAQRTTEDCGPPSTGQGFELPQTDSECEETIDAHD